MHGHPGDDAHIARGIERHQHPPHGPVDHIDAREIARPDGHVGTIVGTRRTQTHQVYRIVREIGVHLADIFISVGDGPFEALDICRAEPQLAAAAYQLDTPGVVGHEAADNPGGAVGRIVVDDEYVKPLLEAKHGLDYRLDILLLVIGRDDDQAVGAVGYGMVLHLSVAVFGLMQLQR